MPVLAVAEAAGVSVDCAVDHALDLPVIHAVRAHSVPKLELCSSSLSLGTFGGLVLCDGTSTHCSVSIIRVIFV